MEEFVSLVKNSNPSCLSKESGSAMKKVLEQRSRLFALNVPEFVSLSSNDQVVLQEENIGPLIELRVATFFHTGLWWAFQAMAKLFYPKNPCFSHFGADDLWQKRSNLIFCLFFWKRSESLPNNSKKKNEQHFRPFFFCQTAKNLLFQG